MVIYLDLEMNGLRGRNGYIIEIGAIKSIKGKVVDKFESFVKLPSYMEGVHPFITVLTGIRDNDLDDAKEYYEILTEFIKWCSQAEAIYCFGDADIASIGYTALKQDKQNKKCIKNAFKFSKCLIDIREMVLIVKPELFNKSLFDIYRILLKKEIDEKKAHRTIYDSMILKEVHEKLKEY